MRKLTENAKQPNYMDNSTGSHLCFNRINSSTSLHSHTSVEKQPICAKDAVETHPVKLQMSENNSENASDFSDRSEHFISCVCV